MASWARAGRCFFSDYDHDPGNRGYLRPPMLPESEEGGAFKLKSSDHYTAFLPGSLERKTIGKMHAAVETADKNGMIGRDRVDQTTIRRERAILSWS